MTEDAFTAPAVAPEVERLVNAVLYQDQGPQAVIVVLPQLLAGRPAHRSPLTVADCTALLVGLGYAGESAVDQLRLALERDQDDTEPSEVLSYALRHEPQAAIDTLRMLADCEWAADELRARRRHIFLDTLGTLPDGPRGFVRDCVWPLACRAWYPPLWFDDQASAAPMGRLAVWRRPAVSIDALVKAWRYSNAEALVGYLRDSGDLHSANYLEAALDVGVQRSVGDAEPIEPRVLLVRPGSPMGHLLRVLARPARAGRDGWSDRALVRDSFVPARAAAAALLSGCAVVPDIPAPFVWRLEVGDWAGGAASLGGAFLAGSSAGLTFAIALVARAVGAPLLDTVHATAAIAFDGRVESLHGTTPTIIASDMRAKARILALEALRVGAPIRVIVGDQQDAAAIEAGVRQFRRAARQRRLEGQVRIEQAMDLGTAVQIAVPAFYAAVERPGQNHLEGPEQETAAAEARRVQDCWRSGQRVPFVSFPRQIPELDWPTWAHTFADELLRGDASQPRRGLILSFGALRRAFSRSGEFRVAVVQTIGIRGKSEEHRARGALIRDELASGRTALVLLDSALGKTIMNPAPPFLELIARHCRRAVMITAPPTTAEGSGKNQGTAPGEQNA